MNLSFLKPALVAAAAIAGIFFAVGFQDNASKFGVIDMAKVVENSDFGKQNQADFNAMKSAREGLLEFIDQYRVLSVEQANKIKDLSIKPNLSSGEKAELESTKAAVIAAFNKNKELALKPNLTPEERNLIEEYARNSANMEQTAQRWLRDFTTELQAWADKQKVESLNRARAAVNEVAKAQGYTLIFEVGVAPYGANDITDAALKAMNAKK